MLLDTLLNIRGWPYWLLAVAMLSGALYWPKRTPTKALFAIAVIAVFAYVPITHVLGSRTLQQQEAHFQMLCKTAGDRVTQRSEGIDGVYLMKIRPAVRNFGDQFTPDDVYAYDAGGIGYINTFLRVTEGATLDPQLAQRSNGGYAWVEATDPVDNKLYRYRLVIKKTVPQLSAAQGEQSDLARQRDVLALVTERLPIDKPTARYGVTWADISTREDREHWVAGGAVHVVNLQTQQVIAERKGYMRDHGMGDRSGIDRRPWMYAHYDACPPFDMYYNRGTTLRGVRETSRFVTGVLVPKG
jgi:hypothetical protein